jgi:putative ABC transport system permease protein
MYQFLEAAQIALSAIWANKLRSFLTVLGNIVAVTSIIAVVSLIQGMNAYVTDAIVSDLGADTFSVQRMPITLSEQDEERNRSNPRVMLEDAVAVMAQSGGGASVSSGSKELGNVRIQGVTREYIFFRTFDAERGRLFTPAEVDRKRPVALLGWDTADKLFGDENPIDKIIKISGRHFRVVGVSAKKGSIFGQSQDDFVVIPLGAFDKIFGSRTGLSVTVLPRHPTLLKAAMDDATVALRIERRLKPDERDNFGLFTSDTILNIYHTATQGIFAVLIGVVALSLVVGGIVIMNIMLMVVTERTQEIGLRKALGARRRDITWQILTESITLSMAGGIVGTTFGFTVAFVIASLTPLKAIVEPWSVAAGIGITALVGLFFGLYPAMRAARLDPIEALRKE